MEDPHQAPVLLSAQFLLEESNCWRGIQVWKNLVAWHWFFFLGQPHDSYVEQFITMRSPKQVYSVSLMETTIAQLRHNHLLYQWVFPLQTVYTWPHRHHQYWQCPFWLLRRLIILSDIGAHPAKFCLWVKWSSFNLPYGLKWSSTSA